MGNILPLVAAVLLAAASLGGRGAAPLSVPGILAFLLAYYAAGRALAGHAASLVHGEGVDPARALHRFHRAVRLHRHLALAGHALILWPGGWSTLCRSVLADAGEVPAFLAALAPWFVLLALSHAACYPAERKLGLKQLPLHTSLFQSMRVGSLVVAPLVMLTALGTGAAFLASSDLEPFRSAADLAARYDFVGGAVLLAGLASVLAVFPVIAMRLLGARPMPPGPLRARLEAYARRVNLPYRDLYVWHTHGTMLNAAVMGVGRRLRCVVFTDALIDQLDEEEVEAVFAHEAGHALHWHLPLFFAFTVSYMLAVFAATRLLPPGLAAAVEEDEVLGYAMTLGGMLFYFGLVFGFVSRRLEQQADVHGFLTVGLPEGVAPGDVVAEPDRHPFVKAVAEGGADPGVHPFVRGLDGIAASMGGVREFTGWRHFSVADRVDFLRRFASDPEVRRRYRTRLHGLLALMGLVFAGFAAAAATDIPVQLAGPDPVSALGRAQAALRRGRPEEARGWIEAGLRGAAARGRALAPSAEWIAPGRPADEVSLIALSQSPDAPGLSGMERFRLRECEALLRSLRGDHSGAAAAAERAADFLGDPARTRPDLVPLVAALRAENLLLLSHVLERGGRPAAAADARARAAAAAREAGPAGRDLLRAAGR